MSRAERSLRGLRRIRTVVFGDRLGVALFLGTLCWVALTWRVGFFISDTYAVANTLVNVASGHLYIDHVEYSLSLGSSQPGLYVHGGRVFGRNYGEVYLALPIYWLLDGLSTLADLRVAATGGVSLALLGCAHQLGGVLDRRPAALLAGSGLALGTFLSGVAWAGALDPRWSGLLALQLTTALAGAAVAVALYRLLAAIRSRRLGVAVGVAAVAASPVGFWATLPKRHVLTAALATVTVASFYASRRRADRTGRVARAGAYAAAGFAAAIHAGEGAVLVGLLAPIDLLTAPANGRRDLGVAAAGLAVGLAPFLLTNALISGNPLLAPRWMQSFNGGSIGPGGVVQTSTGGGGASPVAAVGGAAATAGLFTALLGSVSTALAAIPDLAGGLSAVFDRIVRSLAVATDLDRLYHVFVRSGRIPGVRYRLNENAVIELTMLESMPVGGAIAASVAVAAARTSSLLDRPRSALVAAVASLRTDPRRQTDLLALAYVGALTVAYLPRLPLFSQITVRYLLPTVPLWLYLLGRLDPVGRAVTERARWAGAGYVLGLLVGGAALVAILGAIDPALGEAMQFHALVNLGLAVLTAVALLVGPATSRLRPAAVSLGVTAAATTLFLGLAGLVYFPYGPPVLPVSEFLAGLLPLL